MGDRDDNHCIICSGSNFREDRVAAKIIGLRPPYIIQKCKVCDNRKLLPALNCVEAERLYNDGYFYADQINFSKPEEGDIAPNSTTNHFNDVVPLRKLIFEERLNLIEKMFGIWII
jgi:hypothetical protein